MTLTKTPESIEEQNNRLAKSGSDRSRSDETTTKQRRSKFSARAFFCGRFYSTHCYATLAGKRANGLDAKGA